MTITVDLTEDQLKRLDQLAKQLSVDPRELASAAITSLISSPTEDFERAVQYVLEKNKDLYRRLS